MMMLLKNVYDDNENVIVINEWCALIKTKYICRWRNCFNDENDDYQTDNDDDYYQVPIDWYLINNKEW